MIKRVELEEGDQPDHEKFEVLRLKMNEIIDFINSLGKKK